MKVKLLKIEEDIKEKDFPDFIKRLGYECIKLNYRNYHTIKEILCMDYDLASGMPDFLIYNKKEKFLCEFKSSLDSWHINQIEWVSKNYHIPFMLAYVSYSKTNMEQEKDIEIDTEFEERIKEINISWRIKDIYFKEYADNHPEELGKKFYINGYGSFIGEVPIEVSNKWDNFDKTYFKDKHKKQILINAYMENKLNNSSDIDVLL